MKHEKRFAGTAPGRCGPAVPMTASDAQPPHAAPFGTFAPSRFHRAIIGLTTRMPDSWLGRRLAFMIRRLGLLTLSGPLDIDRFGHRLRLYPFRNVCERRALFTPQFFDARERELIAARLPEDPVFVDIGANVGLYGFHVAAAARGRARILAIEPQADIIARMRANIGFNQGTGIVALECAVGAENGTMTLFVDPGNKGESSVKMIGDGGADAAVEVPTRTLLSILESESIERIDALKIDVEGAEDIVLFPFFAAAPPTLHPGLIVLERSDAWHDDCRALLADHGYRLIAETRLNLVFEKAA